MAQAGDTETETPRSSPVEPPSVELLRAAFPDLEIQSLIGSGGMGAVYKTRQPRLNRIVALKVLPESLAADAQFAERFEREAQLLARLNHPGIVTVYDFGQSGGFFYLLMEYIDGVNLRQAMQAGRFSPEAALALVPHICEALQYAHGEGVLHRDIKPENILLDTRGRLKIADFGIAKMLGEKAGLPLTASGAVIGTPHYMAPEQFEKPREVDQRADIYSLGVVLYEMLTGELPVGRFAPPSEKSRVDPRVDTVVFRALEKERERRFGSAAEVKTSVEQITTGGAGAQTPQMPPIAPSTRQTAKGATASAVLACLSLVPGMLVVLGLFTVSAVEQGVHSSLVVPRIIPFVLFGLISAAFGLAGTALGLSALFQVRRSNGSRAGAKRALVGTVLWPALFAVFIVSLAASRILGGFFLGGYAFVPRLAVATILAVLAGVVVVAVPWWWATHKDTSGRQIGLLSISGITAACLLLPAACISFVAGMDTARRIARASALAHGLSRPMPILATESLPPNSPPPQRQGQDINNPLTPAAPGYPRIVLRYGVPAGQGATIELVTSTGRGVFPHRGLSAFLLASPHQSAAATVVWRPVVTGKEDAEGPRWQIEANTETQSAEASGFRLPADVVNAFGSGGMDISMNTLEDNAEFFYWIRERNGNIPGVGFRCRTFAHGLSETEIAHGGFAGTSTNWAAVIRAENQE
jgi:serine/threonine protein kinase